MIPWYPSHGGLSFQPRNMKNEEINNGRQREKRHINSKKTKDERRTTKRKIKYLFFADDGPIWGSENRVRKKPNIHIRKQPIILLPVPNNIRRLQAQKRCVCVETGEVYKSYGNRLYISFFGHFARAHSQPVSSSVRQPVRFWYVCVWTLCVSFIQWSNIHQMPTRTRSNVHNIQFLLCFESHCGR